jgi:hypothetical protein
MIVASLRRHGAIPILVGVTGHRDLRPEDFPALKHALQTRFHKLKADYPSTPFVLLTSLAEGGDQLAAEVASGISGFELAAVLPTNAADYEKDFDEETSRSAYWALLSRSARTIVCEGNVGESREDQYFVAGEYIARNAQILFAVWDGISKRETDDGEFAIPRGGTADIVRIAGAGVRSVAQLALPEPTIVEHVFALRRQSPADVVAANAAKIGTIEEMSSDSHQPATRIIRDTLTAIERFNQHAARLDSTIRGDLLGQHVEEVADAVATFEKADRLASQMQMQRWNAIRLIAVLMFFSALSQQVYSGPDMRWGWLAGHLAIATLAFAAYWFFFTGKSRRDQNYLDWRGLSEGLRVHIFWTICNLKEQVADLYFAEDRDELAWLRQAIRNVALLTAGNAANDHLALAGKRWLISQRDYFVRNARKAEIWDNIVECGAGIALIAGILVTIVTLAADLWGTKQYCLNLLVLVAGGCFLAAATIKAAGDQIGHSERKSRYRLMGEIFDLAVKKFDARHESGHTEGCRKILLEAGREALAENVSWLRLHRRRRFEISLG